VFDTTQPKIATDCKMYKPKLTRGWNKNHTQSDINTVTINMDRANDISNFYYAKLVSFEIYEVHKVCL